MDRLYWVLFDAAVGYINEDGTSDWSDPGEIDVAGDSLAPAAPTVSVSPKANAILLSIVPPTLNSDGTACVDFKEYGVYYSDAGGIDITNSATYDALYVVAGSKTETTNHSHPSTATTYFVVTAYDQSGNQSIASGETSATPDAAEVARSNYVPNPFFILDEDGDNIPDDWTLQAGWGRVTESFQGTWSIRGQGTGVSAISDKVELPMSNKGLLVSGVAKSSGTSFSLAESASVATTSAPIAYTDASGNIAAVARQNASYDIIELWDVTDKTAPYKIGSIDASGSTSHRSKPFQIYGDYLICGNQTSNHLYIYDISDPASPTLVKDYTLANATGRLAALAVRDWYVFACCDDDTNGGFIETINITTPAGATQTDLLEDVSIPTADFRRAMVRNDILAVSVDDTKDDWVSPTSHSDPDSAWANEANAYDDDTATYADATALAYQWSSYIILIPSQPFASDRIRFYAMQTGTDLLIDIDVYDGSSWTDVYSGTFSDKTWTTKTFTDQVVTQARVRFYYDDTGSSTVRLHEFDFYPSSNRVSLYNASNKTAVSVLGHYGQDGLKKIVLNGSFAYVSCDSGTDANKIVVLNITDPTAIAYETAVGGAGTPNYTGSDALFMSGGYLVNVGAGSDAAKYSVSYWDISAPDLPVLETVSYAFTGDLDAADETGGIIIGVDVDNSKVRVVDPQIAADWEFQVRFYDTSETLIESITVYDGNADLPYTGESWTAFSQVIPEADIPNATKKVEFVCYCNESTGYVYVDSLEAKFES